MKRFAFTTWTREQTWLLASSILVLVTVIVRVRLLDIPLERDEGEYAYIGQLLLQGIPPFSAAYTMKLPGVPALYAIFMAIFGQTPRGIHLGLLTSTIGSITLLFLLGRRIMGTAAGGAAAATYAILSLSFSLLGFFAHATHFVALFAIAGFLALLPAIDQRGCGTAFLSGLFFGLAITMKQHAALIALGALLYLLSQTVRSGAPLRNTLHIAACFTLGTTVPYLALAAYLFHAGTFTTFWFWTVTYAREYASGNSIWSGLQELTLQFGNNMKVAWPLLLLAAYGVIRAAKTRQRQHQGVMIVMLIASFLAVAPGFYFREHYFIMMIPATALLVAAAVTAPVQLSPSQPKWLTKGGGLILFLLASSWTLVTESAPIFRLTAPQVSKSIYHPNPFQDSLEIAAYIKNHTAPNDRIVVIGSEPQIYFYADRRSSVSHIYMYGLMEHHSYALRMQQELVQQLLSDEPSYLVLVDIGLSWLPRPDSELFLFNWLADYLPKRYELVGMVDIVSRELSISKWDQAVIGYEPISDNTVYIYRNRGYAGTR